MQLDRTDFGLIELLQQDARMSNKDLAEKVGISPSTCLERVRRLRRLGALTGFHAEVDPKALGITIQAMISVRLDRHAKVSFDRLSRELLEIPEVISVYVLGGAQDFLVHVASRDVEHLRGVVQTLTSRDDVAHIETSLVFEVARTRVLPNFRQLDEQQPDEREPKAS